METLAFAIVEELARENGLDILRVLGEDRSGRDARVELCGFGTVDCRRAFGGFDGILPKFQILARLVGFNRSVNEVNGYKTP